MFSKLCTVTLMIAALATGSANAGSITNLSDPLTFTLDDTAMTREHRGPRGHRGHRGHRGYRGHRGHTGHSGHTGHTGHKGDRGHRGHTGHHGHDGSTGPQGPIGPQGPVGPTGPTGPRGPQGPKGCDGDRGCEGPRGHTGPRGEPGSNIALCADIFVDGATQVSECEQNGSIGLPFRTIEQALCRAQELECGTCDNLCQVVTILIASGCYNCDEDHNCNQNFIKICGNKKIALIALGPVTIGCATGCACQPADTDHRVGIKWVPSGDRCCQEGVRPTLTISSLNSMADAITPYQSYSNKFRITGDIVVANANCGDVDATCEQDCETPSSCSSSSSSSSFSSCSCPSSSSCSWSSDSSCSSDSSSSSSCSSCFSCGSSGCCDCSSSSSSSSSSEWGKKPIRAQTRAVAQATKLVGEPNCCDQPSNCTVCDSGTDCNCGDVENLCCLQDPCCLPCELSVNAEVFGDVSVEGVAMLYFYKSRIHGEVDAGDSDIVVSERTRFDSLVEVNFMGTVIGSEFMDGITLTGCDLYDPCCISIALRGFFMTVIRGTVSGPCPENLCQCPEIQFDITTNSLFRNCQGSCSCVNITVLDRTNPDPSCTDCGTA